MACSLPFTGFVNPSADGGDGNFRDWENAMLEQIRVSGTKIKGLIALIALFVLK